MISITNESYILVSTNYESVLSFAKKKRFHFLLITVGDLHWKIVSVYIHRTGRVISLPNFHENGIGLGSPFIHHKCLQPFQVMLKMKSRHVAGTITKKKKSKLINN